MRRASKRPAADIVLEGDWERAIRVVERLADTATIERVLDEVVEAEARFAASEMRRGIRNQAPGGRPFAPLGASTLQVRRFLGIRSVKALIASGMLLRSITVTRVARNEHWAGFPNEGRSGRNPATIAAVNEFGITRVVRVTPRMHGFLAAVFGRSPRPGSTIVTRVPPRPVVGPVYEDKFTPERARKRVRGRVTKLLNKYGL